MYSGGLDSTLTALTLAEEFEKIFLVTYSRGYGHWFANRAEKRIAPMEKHLDRRVFTFFTASVKDLFKKVVLDTLISDFRKYRALFMMCVGCKMAMHARTVIYNLEHCIPCTADGAAQTTSWMPDQKPITINEYRRLHTDYGIVYSNPVYNVESREKARERLHQSGLETGTRIGDRDFGTQPFCLYGDVVTTIRDIFKVGFPLRDEYITEFMLTKRPILDDYIQTYFKKRNLDIGELKANLKAKKEQDQL